MTQWQWVATIWALGATVTCVVLVIHGSRTDARNGTARAGQIDVARGDVLGLSVCAGFWFLYWPGHWLLHRDLGY